MTYFYYLTLLPPVELIILGLTARTIKTNEKETRKLSILVLVVFLQDIVSNYHIQTYRCLANRLFFRNCKYSIYIFNNIEKQELIKMLQSMYCNGKTLLSQSNVLGKSHSFTFACIMSDLFMRLRRLMSCFCKYQDLCENSGSGRYSKFKSNRKRNLTKIIVLYYLSIIIIGNQQTIYLYSFLDQ